MLFIFFVHMLLKLQRNYSDEHTCLLLAPNRLKQVKQKWTCSARQEHQYCDKNKMRKMCLRKCLAVLLRRTMCCLSSRESLGQSIMAVVSELPAEVCVSALTLHRALGTSPSLATEVTLACCYHMCFQKGGPDVFRSVAVLLVAWDHQAESSRISQNYRIWLPHSR